MYYNIVIRSTYIFLIKIKKSSQNAKLTYEEQIHVLNNAYLKLKKSNKIMIFIA